MGISVDRDHFEEADYHRFAERLRDDLAALEALLQRDGFGGGERTVGAEMELVIVSESGRALPINRDVLARSLNDRVQLELDRFNLEYNLSPVAVAGHPFTSLEAEMNEAVAALDRIAATHGGTVLAIGILPTLVARDLDDHSMTDLPRYRALAAGLRRLRGAPFELEIDGEESLTSAMDDVTMEGAATSLQIHLRTEPHEFANLYNAAQMATPVVLSAAGNSPLFLERRLWQETRIALFQQAVDPRPHDGADWKPPARVGYGHGWVRRGAHELFAQSVGLFPPLIPICTDEDPMERVRAGAAPELYELRLHHGTVWSWNRVIYDPADGGHLRIELRALPSGPTPIDSVANAAFLVGLTLSLAKRMETYLVRYPFEYARRNFYRAAQHGLESRLVWPVSDTSPGLCEHRAAELVLTLLPEAERGLTEAGVADAEAKRLLDVVRARATTGKTGARWQLDTLARLEGRLSRRDALAELTRRYMPLSKSGAPVHEWPIGESG